MRSRRLSGLRSDGTGGPHYGVCVVEGASPTAYPDNIAITMSTTIADPVSHRAGESEHDADMGALLVRSVPRSTLRALSVLGAQRDLSREAYVRELVERHTQGAGT